MKVIGVVVLTGSAITFPLPDPGKARTVALCRKSCIQNISVLCKATNMNTPKTLNLMITRVISYFYDEKVKSYLFSFLVKSHSIVLTIF